MNTQTKLKLMFKRNISLSVVMANALLLIFISSCGSDESKKTESSESKKNISDLYDAPKYDPHRGEGKFTTVDLGEKLDVTMADAGQKIFDVKCNACHKLTSEKLVGPGWTGVTSRHKPEWIMNFITNPDAMIDKDPAVQAQLEICLVRMPNQSLTDDDARHILEFMRKNDGVK
jgi:hypothetical protein